MVVPGTRNFFSTYFQANCSSQKCDANRLHATDWPGSKITGWVMRAAPSQESNPTTMKPGNDRNGDTQTNTVLQHLPWVWKKAAGLPSPLHLHWLCCVCLAYKWRHGTFGLAITIPPSLKWYLLIWCHHLTTFTWVYVTRASIAGLRWYIFYTDEIAEVSFLDYVPLNGSEVEP